MGDERLGSQRTREELALECKICRFGALMRVCIICPITAPQTRSSGQGKVKTRKASGIDEGKRDYRGIVAADSAPDKVLLTGSIHV